MKLRPKMGLILGGTIAALVFCSYLIARYYVVTGFERLEFHEIQQDIERALGAFATEFREIRTIARENAYWDGTYVFLRNPAPGFLEGAFPTESFSAERIHLLAYVNLQGKIVALRLRTGHAVENPAGRPDVTKEMVRLAALVKGQDSPRIWSGVVTLSDGPMLVAIAPVLRSTLQGPSRGALICGRRLDAEEVSLLSKSTKMELSIFTKGFPVPSDVKAVELAFPTSTLAAVFPENEIGAASSSPTIAPVLIRSLSNERIGGYSQLFDVEGHPNIVVRVTKPRQIHAQAQTAQDCLIGITLLGGTIIGLIALVLLEKTVVARVIRLSQDGAVIGKSGDFSKRLLTSGNDELTGLATSINSSLAVLEHLNESQQQTEVALRSAKEYAEKLVQTAHAIVVGLDTEGNIIVWNEAAEKITGYSRAELENRNWLDVIIPKDRYPEIWEEFRCLRGGDQTRTFESPIITKSGDERYIVWHNSQLREHGQLVGTISFGIDISARKQAEEELRQSKETFDTAFRFSPEGMIILTLAEGRCIEVNDAYLRIMEYGRAEVIGKTGIELGIWVNPKERSLLLQQLQAHQPVREAQVALRAKSGKIRKVRISANAIRLQGKPCLLAIARDTTEQELLEQQLRHAQKMEVVTQFAGGMAHDFNNILTGILGNIELLLKEIKHDAKARKMLEVTLHAALQGRSLTQQLLTISRRQVIQSVSVDLNASVRELIEMLRHLVGENVEIAAVLAEDLGTVEADPGSMSHIIMNLVLNARDAMPWGGRITIETRTVGIAPADHLPSTSKETYVMLSVTDTGVGMDETTRARIFEPFFTTKPAGKGTGLGLCTVLSILQHHGGHIAVDSKSGKGTTVKVYLPCSAETAETAPAKDLQDNLATGSETILVVEDNGVAREITVQFLAEGGYRALAARDGSEAMAISKRHRGEIHLLLTDVVMPGMSGPELAQMLVRSCPRMRILYMSGYSDVHMFTEGRLSKGRALILKPFLQNELMNKVRDVLDGTHKRRVASP